MKQEAADMRWLPRAIPILIGIIALDFALVFGFEAFRILASPVSGLEQPAFARVVHGLGRIARLGPDGVVRLAAMLGAVYLAIAGMLGMHLASRLQALRGGRIAHDLLDAALILIVVSTILVSTPAMLEGATEFLIQQRLPLWLVGLAATLSMVERLPEDQSCPPGIFERLLTRMLSRRKPDRTAYVSPALRPGGATARWNELRREAGMKLCANPSQAPQGSRRLP
jgi:hypothetical protein